MGLVVQLMYLVLQGFAVLLTLQESAGSSVPPSPSHGMQSRINAASPASQPNVRPLKLAPAPVSTKLFIPLLSPNNPVLPPYKSAAPSGDVPRIVPSLSPSTSHRKAPNMGGRKLAPENLVLIVTPLPKSPQNPPMTQPLIHNYAPSISPQIKKPNIPSASPPSNLPSYSPPLTPSMPEVSPSILPGPDISSMSTPLPSFDHKGNGKPIVAPSTGTNKQVSPLDSPTKAPMKSYSRDPATAPRPLSVLKSPLHAARLHSPTPSPSISVVRHFNSKKSFTSPVPSIDLVHSTASKLLPHGHSPVKAPMQNSHSDSVKAPSHSLIKSPPHKWVQRISPIPQTPYYKHRRTENNSSSSNPSFVVPPASTNEDIAAPSSNPPKANPHSRHKSRAPPIQNAVASANSPSASAPVSPTRVSQEMTIPHFPSPNSPSGASSPKNPKVPHLPHIQALPPPPPNEDCEPLSCREPYTNNPSGSPCGCVLAMQVRLRLNLPLYTFFPLVSDLAAELSRGLVMKQGQVRIMGANADETQEKTVVLLDLVPFEAKFDNSTAYLIYQKFFHKQLAIEPYYFGNYEVLYLRYPGLPASPYTPSTFAGQAYSDQGDKGRPLKPLGVDVRKHKHKKELKGSIIAIIILLAFLSLTLCCGVAWVMFFRQRSKAQPELSPITIVPSLAKSSGFGASKIGSGLSSFSPSYTSGLTPYTGTAKTFSASEIERATDSFNASRILGEGGFGIVYSGVLVDGTEVAVKVLKKDNQQGGREFLSEVEMLSRLHHRNLVKLLGICMAEHARCLIYELIANGSVESHLHGVDKDNAPLDWNARLKVALGAARGLAYLHEDSSPRVIHRDFKSSNILLEHDFTPKVSDFGLARIASDVENQHISTRVMGTFGYVAPEYAMTGHLLIKSDVYSYGVVLLELLTGRKPVDMSRPSGQENLVTWARPLLTSKEGLELMIDQSLMPDYFFESIAKVAAIASMCVQPEVSDRPFMSEVVQALKLIYNQCCATNNSGSKICSPEHISFHSSSTNSGRMPYHLEMQSPVSDVEWGLRASEVFSASARFASTNKKSLWRHSSPGPLRSRRVLPFFPSMRRWSGDSTSEHRASLRLWSRSR